MKKIKFTSIRPFVRSAKRYRLESASYTTNANYSHFLIYVLSGVSKVFVNDVTYNIEKNDILIIRPGDKYHFVPSGDLSEFIFVDFDYTQENSNSGFAKLYDIWDNFKKDKILEYVEFLDLTKFNQTVHLKNMHILENKLLRIVREHELYASYFVLKSSAIMKDILSHIASAFSNINNENKAQKIIEYLDNNFSKELTNEKIGREFGIHPNHVNLLIKKETGYTLHKYLLLRRISYGAILLEKGAEPIYVISEKSGFKDAKTFTRAFKSVMGMVPASYSDKKDFETTPPLMEESKMNLDTDSTNSVYDNYKSDILSFDILNNAYQKASKIVSLNMLKFMDEFPFLVSVGDGSYYVGRRYDDMSSGYWTGLYILAYDMTKQQKYYYVVSKYIDKLSLRLFEYDYTAFTEMGLLYVPSCVSAYNICHIEKARGALIRAADILSAVYKLKDGEYFVDNNYLNTDDEKTQTLKISSMVNCSLLYWAYNFTGVTNYKKIADRVTDFAIENLIDKDGTVYWDLNFKKEGKPSCIIGRFARTISWCLYGLSVKLRFDKSDRVYKKIVKVLNKYIDEIMSTDIKSLDSTMLSSFVCAIYDISKEVNNNYFNKYIECADIILKRLIDEASLDPLSKTDGLLGYSSGGDGSKRNERTSSTVIGDYFYFEAITRKLKGLKTSKVYN